MLLDSGYLPTQGDLFPIVSTTGGVSGVFATETLPTLGSGLGLDVIYRADAVELLVVPLDGDFDMDGDVDGADALEGQRLGASLDGWEANFGTGSASVSGVAAVPEPSALMLVLTSIFLVGNRRR